MMHIALTEWTFHLNGLWLNLNRNSEGLASNPSESTNISLCLTLCVCVCVFHPLNILSTGFSEVEYSDFNYKYNGDLSSSFPFSLTFSYL